MDKALKTRQICLFFAVFLPVIKFFMMPSVVASVSAQDMWISVIIDILLDFAVILTVSLALKDEDTDFFGTLEKRYGKTFSKVVMAFYAVFFLLKTLLSVNEQKDYVEYTLYMTNPNVLTFMPVFLIVFYLSLQKLRVWGRLADGLIIVALFGYALLFALSVPNTDLNELLPVAKSGYKNIFSGAFKAENWFSDGAYFLFFVGNYEKSKKSTLKILLSFAASGIIVLIFTVIFYGTFSSVAFRQRFALTEISKYSSVINNIGRFDYLALFSLLFTAVFSLSLPFYFAVNLITRILSLKTPAIVSVVVCGASAAFHLIFNRYFFTIETFVTEIAYLYTLILGTVLPVALSLTMIRRRKNETQSV